MSIRRLAVLLFAAAGLAAGSAAYAQPTGDMSDAAWEEFSCVYTYLMEIEDDPYFDVVDAYLAQATEGELFESAMAVIESAADSCAEKHDWNAERLDVAVSMGMAGAVADSIESYFLDQGFSGDELNEIISLIDIISEDEMFYFIAEDWRADEEFKAGVAKHLKSKGIEGDPIHVEKGMVLLETYAIGMFQAGMWMDIEES